MKVRVHAELRRARGANSASSVAASASCGGACEVHAHEEAAGGVVALDVAELLRVDDVAAGLVQQARHRMHDALASGHDSVRMNSLWAPFMGAHCRQRV